MYMMPPTKEQEKMMRKDWADRFKEEVLRIVYIKESGSSITRVHSLLTPVKLTAVDIYLNKGAK